MHTTQSCSQCRIVLLRIQHSPPAENGGICVNKHEAVSLQRQNILPGDKIKFQIPWAQLIKDGLLGRHHLLALLCFTSLAPVLGIPNQTCFAQHSEGRGSRSEHSRQGKSRAAGGNTDRNIQGLFWDTESIPQIDLA